MHDELLAKITSKQALVGVVGLGYVGLPLALTFADAGFRVLGFDVDTSKIKRLAAGQSYIGHIEPGRIQTAVSSGKFAATSDMSRLREPEAILICVPTPLTASRDPDLQYIESTARDIGKTLRAGQLIVLESTTYPGTTAELLYPTIMAGHKDDLANDETIFIAYSPEREDPGNRDWSTSKVPKVVGGLGERSCQLAVALYRQVIAEVVPVRNAQIAEACKILENVYRAVNIAMINELKIIFDHLGIDVWEVIEAAKTKPFGFQAFYPGPGLGGHCIPIDPFYLSWIARRHDTAARFIELAGEVNASMPHYVLERVTEALNDVARPVRGSKVLILGVAYKRDVDDPRESPAFRLMELLAERGALLRYNDPHIPRLPKMRSFEVPDLTSISLSAEILAEQDCVLIVTDHSAYDWEFIGRHARLIVDTRNAMSKVQELNARVVKA